MAVGKEAEEKYFVCLFYYLKFHCFCITVKILISYYGYFWCLQILVNFVYVLNILYINCVLNSTVFKYTGCIDWSNCKFVRNTIYLLGWSSDVGKNY